MDQIFGDMKDVIFYIDDLLITGSSDEAHFNNIKRVFERILSYGLVPNFARSLFFKKSLRFLGHDIDANGIYANHDKIEAIVSMPEPKSAAELSTFPECQQEKMGVEFRTLQKFDDLKTLISLPPALTYFNPELPIGIATDASKRGLGAVLFHTEKDGKEKPIAFASRTLAKSEINYTNIEREALAIMFAIKRFQEYLIGTKFTIVTDHKPLIHIFTKGLKDNSTMSLRLPQVIDDDVIDDIAIINDFGDIPLSFDRIRDETSKDFELSQALHEGHMGAGKIKSLAKDRMWWSGMVNDIDLEVRSCDDCNIFHDNSKKIQNPWVLATKPFERIHVDYAGPFFTKNWLIIVDAYSKFPIIVPVKNITTEFTLKEIFRTISLFGIETIVTDNGTNFTSKDFEIFCSNYGIKHVLTSAYHQQSNGQAERMVRTFKAHMKRNIKIDLETALDRFLFNYRNTPNDTTGVTPSKRVFNRDIRIKWDLLKPLEDEIDKVNISLPRNRTFNVGDFVWYKKQSDDTWCKGNIRHKESDTMFQVNTDKGLVRRHIDQLRKRECYNRFKYYESDPKNSCKEGSVDISENSKIPFRPLRIKQKSSYLKDFIT
ncbi:uncharacterized protein LOC135925708 [Gordionus sp. m RMFG-2023]|uniref:uncharacterized protein LOC135925708 n=1 Tax=Gordionus sp. m RMFG-2023 TaxID=3053472 RepID=UPI0031FE2340